MFEELKDMISNLTFSRFTSTTTLTDSFAIGKSDPFGAAVKVCLSRMDVGRYF